MSRKHFLCICTSPDVSGVTWPVHSLRKLSIILSKRTILQPFLTANEEKQTEGNVRREEILPTWLPSTRLQKIFYMKTHPTLPSGYWNGTTCTYNELIFHTPVRCISGALCVCETLEQSPGSENIPSWVTNGFNSRFWSTNFSLMLRNFLEWDLKWLLSHMSSYLRLKCSHTVHVHKIYRETDKYTHVVNTVHWMCS